MPDAARDRRCPAGSGDLASSNAPLCANIAIDENFAAGHTVADMVESVTGAFDANVFRIAHTQTEYLADIDAVTARPQFDMLDLRGRLASKQVRDQRRQVEPLIGALAQCEAKRFHGTKSRKWKW
jgi:hypothetical protein